MYAGQRPAHSWKGLAWWCLAAACRCQQRADRSPATGHLTGSGLDFFLEVKHRVPCFLISPVSLSQTDDAAHRHRQATNEFTTCGGQRWQLRRPTWSVLSFFFFFLFGKMVGPLLRGFFRGQRRTEQLTHLLGPPIWITTTNLS